MLNRLFRRRETAPASAPAVRAEPEFDVEGDKIIARAVCIRWEQDGTSRKLRLQRDLRPADPRVTRGGARFGVCLMRDAAVEKTVAEGLDFATAVALHRVLWNWLGQLRQNGHEVFPMTLMPPEGGFDHDHWTDI